jgi:BirA family biotin operon repressor/biotin-[acetyl-CoA-carboxylase] ligase
MSDRLALWAPKLEALIALEGLTRIDRVAVLAETGSTQDAARMMAGGRPGLVVLAGRQTAGRGRLGRAWTQHADMGVAATFVVECPADGAGELALASGVAAARAIEDCTPVSGAPGRIGLRWPNDVVVCGDGRKLAGVLVERADGLAVVGIGINVLQGPNDWPDALRGRAASLTMLGSLATRSDVACRLLTRLDRALGEGREAVVAEWRRRDTLLGTRRAFLSDGRRVEGVVEAIDPDDAVTLRRDDGSTARLPAAVTSLVQEP